MAARVRVDLNQEQATTLMMWVGSGKTEQRLALRAKVILLASEGLSLHNIAEKTGLNWQSCLKWRKRFLEQGIDGLKDKQGRGRPQEISPDERVSVVALACTTPPDGSTRWSMRKLAEVTGHGSPQFRKSCLRRSPSRTRPPIGVEKVLIPSLKKSRRRLSGFT